LVQAGLKIGHLLTQSGDFRVELVEKGKERSLGGSGDQIPEFLGKGRLLRHGLVVDTR
jgi:hypothetical protein